jgi:hypothetical protein
MDATRVGHNRIYGMNFIARLKKAPYDMAAYKSGCPGY